MKSKLGFIGIGKIAGALVEGLCTSDMEPAEILLSPRNPENAAYWAGKYPNVEKAANNQEVLDRSDIVFIALRPAVAPEILEGLSFDKRHTVISLIPLLSYAALVRVTGPVSSVCRAIPLPTVVTHHCPIPVYKAPDAAIRLLGYVGHPLPVADERQLHALWTLTGLITPYYDLLGALSAWTKAHGVDEGTANRYIADMFESLSSMAIMAAQSGPIDFDELASHAATPNGMNEQAGREIREQGAHGAYLRAADRLLQRFAGI